jgi:xylulose-5-phosphate/fructose-6-phosphate phosphoketolase
MRKLFRQFSFPGGIPSHAAPETPGSINEGGELGYALVHAYGAVFDNPDLIAACVVGDGESETGPLAASWHSNKFLNPTHDGAVLPILHLNGYKIANPTILGRMSDEEIKHLFLGYGHEPLFVEGDDPQEMHRLMADSLETAFDRIGTIQKAAREGNAIGPRPAWPMIVLRSSKRWTGPKEVDGLRVEGFWRAHQVPIADPRGNPDHLALLERWMRSYGPETLFDEAGSLRPELQELTPIGERRMGANPHANWGTSERRTQVTGLSRLRHRGAACWRYHGRSNTHNGRIPAGCVRLNDEAQNFRIMGPDETVSNRLDAVFEVTERIWMESIEPYDVHAFRKVSRRRFEIIAILTNRDAERERPERRSEDRSYLALTS